MKATIKLPPNMTNPDDARIELVAEDENDRTALADLVDDQRMGQWIEKGRTAWVCPMTVGGGGFW